MTFFNSSHADAATFINNGGTASFAYGGVTGFTDASTADNGSFTNNGGTANGAYGGSTQFGGSALGSATAANATLIANGGSNGGAGGYIQFFGASTGGTARVEVFGNGNLEISSHSAPGVTIGSLEGTGNVFLGANNLTTGNNNLSSAFSGVIQDGGQNGGTGGSLTKIGTGTLTLAGPNTYTGGTTVNGGTLAVNGSIAGAVTVNNGATLGGSGTVGGLVTVASGGTLSPGNSPGTLTVGSLTFNTGSFLNIELEGTMPGSQYDQLHVAGSASLAGTLQVVLINGFVPTGTISFDILDWATHASTFTSVQLPTLGGLLSWNTSQLYTLGVLSVTGPNLAGDYNNNGVVDAADYTVWRDTLGSTTDLRANGDNSGASAGKVDQADYAIWKTNFGNHSGAGASSNAAVPEPSTFVLLALAVAGWCLRRRRGA